MTHGLLPAEGEPLLAGLAPAGTAVAECTTDVEPAPLFPTERRTIDQALDRRRREFATARLCARCAMVALGFPPREVGTGACGAPVWPTGLVGSITHCAGYRGAVLARAEDWDALGIDAEPLGPRLTQHMREFIATEEERHQLDTLAASTGLSHWDRLLFSAKESVYKACFALTGHSLWFTDVSLRVRGPACEGPHSRGSFSVIPGAHGPFLHGISTSALDGRWTVSRGLILTLVAWRLETDRPRSRPRVAEA